MLDIYELSWYDRMTDRAMATGGINLGWWNGLRPCRRVQSLIDQSLYCGGGGIGLCGDYGTGVSTIAIGAVGGGTLIAL